MHVLVVFLLLAAVVFAIVGAAGVPGRFAWGWLAVACVAGALLVPQVTTL